MNLERRIKRLQKGTPVWVGTKRTPFEMGVIHTPAFILNGDTYVSVRFIGNNIANMPIRDVSKRTMRSIEELVAVSPKYEVVRFRFFTATHFAFYEFCFIDEEGHMATYKYECSYVFNRSTLINVLVNNILLKCYSAEFSIWDELRPHIEATARMQIRALE